MSLPQLVEFNYQLRVGEDTFVFDGKPIDLPLASIAVDACNRLVTMSRELAIEKGLIVSDQKEPDKRISNLDHITELFDTLTDAVNELKKKAPMLDRDTDFAVIEAAVDIGQATVVAVQRAAVALERIADAQEAMARRV